jgi:hypothetical protein
MGVRRDARQQRETARQSAPTAGFLLHTEPRKLLDRTVCRLTRIAGE